MDNRKKRNKNREYDKEYDGVIYEPSYEKRQTDDYDLQSRRRTPAPKKTRAPAQKSQFTLFYIITLFTGVLVCIVVFAIVFNSVTKNNSKTPNQALNTTPAPSQVAFSKVNQFTGLINTIDAAGKRIGLMDLATEKDYDLKIDASTALKNRFGELIVFAELKVGDIVDISTDPTASKVISIDASSQAWESKMITGLKMDAGSTKATLGNDSYTYTDKTIIIDNTGADIADIKPIDLVTIRGFKDKLWYVEVIKGHSSILITNKDKIKDGIIEIDTTIVASLDESETVEVGEGAHRVVIKGSNIEPYIEELVASEGVPAVLDLGEVQFKTGILVIKCDEPDFILTINGEVINTLEPILLDFGEYNIRVEKDGYTTWEEKVILDQPEKEITATILKEVQTAKLFITTNPVSDVDIYIDGMYIGKSPIEYTIEHGEHRVGIKKTGYSDQELSYTIVGDMKIDFTPWAIPPEVTDVTAPDNSGYYTNPSEPSGAFEFTP